MAVDAKKHTTIAAGEVPSRTALALALLSIDDVIPVANATEATQVAVAVAATGQNLATNPVVVSRADAPGLHRIEYTYDPAGLVWIGSDGVMRFASVAAANTWASANSALLVAGDRARVGVQELIWSGAVWFFAPGQVLASMVGPATNVAGADQLVGTVISTPVLAVGQKVKIVGTFSGYSTAAGGIAEIAAKWRNNAADVTATTFDGSQTKRVYSPTASFVAGSGAFALIVAAASAAKISAAIYTVTAASGVYGADGTHLWIESA